MPEPRDVKGERVGGTGVLGALADSTRMALYEFVARAAEAVGRDEAAAAVGIPRQTAAYHLDRLAADGLLEVGFVRRTGRTGPGAGRPAKLYRPTNLELEITVPPRRYLLAARVFLEAVAAGGGSSALPDSAHRTGVAMGGAGLETALEGAGFVPENPTENEIRFLNCPFHALAATDRQTTCGMNLELVKGMIEGAQHPGAARLEPEPGYCCVRIRITPD